MKGCDKDRTDHRSSLPLLAPYGRCPCHLPSPHSLHCVSVPRSRLRRSLVGRREGTGLLIHTPPADRDRDRPVSPTGVEWVGSGTRPISSHSSRFLVSSLVPHSVPRNRLSFVEISPSQVKWRTEQTKDDPRQ